MTMSNKRDCMVISFYRSRLALEVQGFAGAGLICLCQGSFSVILSIGQQVHFHYYQLVRLYSSKNVSNLERSALAPYFHLFFPTPFRFLYLQHHFVTVCPS